MVFTVLNKLVVVPDCSSVFRSAVLYFQYKCILTDQDDYPVIRLTYLVIRLTYLVIRLTYLVIRLTYPVIRLTY